MKELDSTYSQHARVNMIKQQCRTWDVLNPVILELLQSVPREDFVPPHFRHLAFADTALSLGHNQSMLTPKEEAKILDKLQIKHSERVYEIGTGSGYFTALLAKQSKHVDSIEIFEDFLTTAAQKLHAHQIHNIELEKGDGLAQNYKLVEYDVIVFTGSLKILPKHFLSKLNIGGRLFAFLGESPLMKAVLFTKVSESNTTSEILFETHVNPLMATHHKNEKFVF
jgi:protein-L-isoaspartate(D-aspartate) O-methyltransferase